MKLIPKYQSPWTPINYKPPENSEEVRVTNKQETHKPRSKEWSYHTKYNPIYTVGDTLEKTPEYKLEINPQTGRPYTVQEKDLPLSGTDPVGEFIVAGEVLGGLSPLGKILFPYAARFTSGPVRNWIASKALNDVLAKDALTGGVNKVVLNNGNILLQLASHSSRKPRQLRIEPQGNNAFRVHASTWGGLTDVEKKLLYEALYKELSENAKILFPESNPDYLATRGTVASLLRLKRDSRFTPGSTLQKLMYKDKDGSIKFFEGTSFTRKPTFNSINYTPNQQQATGETSLSFFEIPSKITPEQWTAAQDAAIARGDMAEAQRLRDLHFRTYQNGDMVDVNGNPIHVYHGSPAENITEFYKPNDPRYKRSVGKATAEEGIYTSPNESYASLYTIDLDGDGLASNFNSGRVYDLYSNTKLLPVNSGIEVNYGVRISKKAADEMRKKGYNGITEMDEHVVLEPNQLKSADAVTYDDNGVRIPLGKRDNFNVNDIRYGLVPWLLGGTTAGYLYNNK